MNCTNKQSQFPQGYDLRPVRFSGGRNRALMPKSPSKHANDTTSGSMLSRDNTLGIKFIQGNLHHSHSATAEIIKRYVQTGDKNTILLIQEPMFYYGQIRGLADPSRVILFRPNSGQKQRTCILLPKNVYGVLLPQYCDSDCTAVLVQCQRFDKPYFFVCVSIYMPFDKDIDISCQRLFELKQFCDKNQYGMIIGADTNAHSKLYGSTNDNIRGIKLMEFLISNQFQVENLGNTPTFVISNRQEVLDVTFSYGDLKVDSWCVSRECSFSDHRFLNFTLNLSVNQFSSSRNVKKTDWQKFSNQINNFLDYDQCYNINSKRKIDSVTKVLQDTLFSCYEQSCPLTHASSRARSWWSPDLTVLKREARRLHNKARKTFSAADWEAYRCASSKYTKAIRAAKYNSWKTFCGTIESGAPMARIYKVLSGAQNSESLGMLETTPGNYTSSFDQVLDHLMDIHLPGSEFIGTSESDIENLKDKAYVSQFTGSPRFWNLANAIISEDKIFWAINSMKSQFSAPGPDGLYFCHWKQALPSVSSIMVELFRASIAWGHIPKSLRQSRLVYIPKPGKENYISGKSFRPINVSNTLLRILEKIIDRFLRDEYVSKLPFSPAQHAYLPTRGCDSCVHALVSAVESAWDRGNYSICVFGDISGAFNKTSFRLVMRALERWKVATPLKYWIFNMLSNRITTVKLGDISRSYSINMGLPQGGSASCLLWLMVIDSLLCQLQQARIKVFAYSDDICIFMEGPFLSDLCDLTNQALKIVENFCNDSESLSLNGKKSEVMLFTRKLYKTWGPQWKPIKIFGDEIPFVNHVKYLGVTLDNRLHWRIHLEEKCAKIKRCLMQCQRALGRVWGPKPFVMRWAYTMCARASLIHCSIVWHHRLKYSSACRVVESVQRLGLLLISSALRSTPTQALEILLDIMPLPLVIKQFSANTFLRLYRHKLWCRGVLSGHRSIEQFVQQTTPLLLKQCDQISVIYNFNQRLDIDIPERFEWEENEAGMMPEEAVWVYTDGSRWGQADEPSTGAAFLIRFPPPLISPQDMSPFLLPLGKYVTVFQAEVYAILKSLDKLLELDIRGKEICIFSDSQSALKALASFRITSSLIHSCVMKTGELESCDNRVRFIWVPAHQNYTYNEIVDAAAKDAAVSPCGSLEPTVPISVSTQKAILKCEFLQTWAKRWVAGEGLRQSRLLLVGPDSQKSKFLYKLSRNNLRLLIGLATGHYFTAKMQCIFGLRNSMICDFCNLSDEDILHFLSVCPRWKKLREKFFGFPFLQDYELRGISYKNLLVFGTATKRFD